MITNLKIMIAYKWGIKQNNQIYSLINFRIFPSIKDIKFAPYEIGKTYENPINLRPTHRTDERGFYFWKEPINDFFERFNKHLKYYKQPEINIILKCKIDKKDLLGYGFRNSIRAKKFKVLEEVKNGRI